MSEGIKTDGGNNSKPHKIVSMFSHIYPLLSVTWLYLPKVKNNEKQQTTLTCYLEIELLALSWNLGQLWFKIYISYNIWNIYSKTVCKYIIIIH